jgi:DNA invertase Pin-like site-specific DNA recombinase
MRLIGYVRVSTEKQGQSGLGLEAQLSAIDLYGKANGGEVVKVYREVESGTDSTRPQLSAAVAHAKRIRGRLVIAKLDRLARNVHLVSGLMESGVDFIAVDNPHANKLTVHILAAVAEDEAERISQRTKAALAAAKARGIKLGSARPDHWEGMEDRRQAGAVKGAKIAKAKRDAEAAPVYSAAAPIARQMDDDGHTLQEIADELNAQGLTTVRGMPWSRMQVSRLLNSGLCGAAAVAAAAVLSAG